MTDEQRAREIARNICVSLSTGFTHIVSDEGDVVSVETAILSALRAVREDCAKIAESDRASNGKQTLSAQRIAAAIRAATQEPQAEGAD